jgi:hypothetical protein
MDVWDNDVLDEFEEAHITFKGGRDGEIAFAALSGSLDVRYGARDGSAGAEFSWEGFDDSEPVCGRGWATPGTAGRPRRSHLHSQGRQLSLRLRTRLTSSTAC